MALEGMGRIVCDPGADGDVRLSSPRRPVTTPPSPPAAPSGETVGLLVVAAPGPGVLHQLSGVFARHGADITLVEILENRPAGSRTYFEVAVPAGDKALQADLAALPIVRQVTVVKTFQRIYGKRIIIMGGGAQVGQVALGAISEADRHNIRGEHISVDTIPLVGEQPLADAVRAVARLPRARVLVLAGALMGGDIEKAVREVREQGVLVISLNMAGSVPEAADLVVTDPVQSGVMAVMAVADTAQFSLERLKRRTF
jgi:energy-converting hydrogenase B subunit Q